MRAFMSVLVLCVLGIPATAAGQSGDGAPRVEVGAALTAFAAPAGSGSLAFGPRVTAKLTRQVGLQIEARFPTASIFRGMYGVRVRYLPEDEDALWYAFGGVGGSFAVPRVTHYDANGVRSSVRTGGGVTLPILISGGLGARVAAAKHWAARLEGEAWTSTYGGFALAAGFEVAFGAGRQ